MTLGRLHLAILIVNGKQSSWKGRLWLELCLKNIVEHTKLRVYKVFLWNHDHKNRAALRLVEKYKEHVIPFSEDNYSIVNYDSPKVATTNSVYYWRGFHVHRTPLQLLYEAARATFNIDVVVTMDNDSWPIKEGWDDFFYSALKTPKRIVGVWRSELKGGIKPFVHPSGLGIRRGVIEKEGLRFDKKPDGVGEDTVSHFSRYLFRKYGRDALAPLYRSNIVNLHPVAGGVYGDWIYHHHLGNRFTAGQRAIFKGSALRGETEESNRIIISEMTDRVFTDYDNYMAELRGL